MSENTSLQEEMNESTSVIKSNNDSTYLNLNFEDGSVMEADLVSIKQKGQSIKFLEIIISGVDPQSGKKQEARKVVESKEEFLLLKDYFTKLKWEE